MRRKATRIGLAVAIPGLALLAACGSVSHPNGTAHLAPVPSLTTDDTIEAVDFAVESGRTLHLVYQVVRRDKWDTPRSKEIWYERGDLRTGTWSPPETLVTGEVDQPRVVLIGDTLLVAYRREWTLESAISKNGGKTWSHLSPVQDVISYDLLSNGDRAVVVSMISARDEDGFLIGRRFRLIAKTLNAGGPESTAIATDSWPRDIIEPPPRLVSDGDNLAVVFLVDIESAADRPVRGRSTRNRVTICRSRDFGTTWSFPIQVGAGFGACSALDAVHTATGLYLSVLDDTRIRILRVSDDGQSIEFTHPFGPRSTHQFFQYVTSDGFRRVGHITWVDTRFAKGDLLTPFSDQPYWFNNDAFSSDLSKLTSKGSRLHPVQWSRRGGYVRTIRSKYLGDSIVAVWCGRLRVGRGEKEYGEKYRINYSTVTSQ